MVKSTAVCLNRNWNFAHLNDILIWCDITLYSISNNLRLLVPDGCDAHVNHCHISHLGPQLFDHSWAEKNQWNSDKHNSNFEILYQGQSSCLSTVHFWNCHKPHRAECGIWTWIWPKNWEVLMREKVAMENFKPLKFWFIKPLLKVPWLDQHRSLRSARGRTFCSWLLLSPWQPSSFRLNVFILWMIIFSSSYISYSLILAQFTSGPNSFSMT